jgi:hypothetical protein
MDASDMAVAGAAAARVTAGEVRALILTAQGAWRRQRELGLTEDGFDAWRRGALWDAVRKASFRALGQREYGVALAAFQRLGGAAPRAAAGIGARETGPEGDRRRAEHALRQACAAAADAFGGDAGQALAYARVLLRQIHRAELASATAKQIWQVVFTLRSRAAKRRNPASRPAPLAPAAREGRQDAIFGGCRGGG